jgi:hypothetical protein
VALAIVFSEHWRVVVNLPERNLLGLKVGRKVWFSLSSDPWRFRQGRVKALTPPLLSFQTSINGDTPRDGSYRN